MTGHLTVRARTARAGLLAALAALPLATAATATASDEPIAQAAKTINVSERASLHLVRKSGSTLWQAGTATGTLPGTVSTRFKVTLTSVTGTLKITTRGGTVTLSASGKPRSGGTNARFGGTMRVTGGTGRYSGASGSANFEGVVNRRTWATSVSASGRLSY